MPPQQGNHPVPSPQHPEPFLQLGYVGDAVDYHDNPQAPMQGLYADQEYGFAQAFSNDYITQDHAHAGAALFQPAIHGASIIPRYVAPPQFSAMDLPPLLATMYNQMMDEMDLQDATLELMNADVQQMCRVIKDTDAIIQDMNATALRMICNAVEARVSVVRLYNLQACDGVAMPYREIPFEDGRLPSEAGSPNISSLDVLRSLTVPEGTALLQGWGLPVPGRDAQERLIRLAVAEHIGAPAHASEHSYLAFCVTKLQSIRALSHNRYLRHNEQIRGQGCARKRRA